MSASTRETRSSRRSAPTLLLVLALGLFLTAYGGSGISTGDHQGIRAVFPWFQTAAGVSFIIAAALGAAKEIQARER